MRQQVTDAGYQFLCGREPAEREVARIRERLPIAPAGEASVLGNRELFGRLAARAMLPVMKQTMARWRPDVVIREPCEYASAAVAVRLGIPTAQVAISLAEGEWSSIQAAVPALEELEAGLVARLTGSAYLTRLPASLDPSPFAATVRFREPARRPARLPNWWAGSTQPLVYLTFGSVFGSLATAAAVYRAVVPAVAGLPVRVLLTVGRRFDPSALGALPANVHLEAWVEQAAALAAATLVVCHGGSGTVYGALAAGVPVVAVPAFADQFLNGRRIAVAGAGVTVEANPGRAEGPRRLAGEREAPRIAAAARAVLAEPAYRAAARRIGAEMSAAPTSTKSWLTC